MSSISAESPTRASVLQGVLQEAKKFIPEHATDGIPLPNAAARKDLAVVAGVGAAITAGAFAADERIIALQNATIHAKETIFSTYADAAKQVVSKALPIEVTDHAHLGKDIFEGNLENRTTADIEAIEYANLWETGIGEKKGISEAALATADRLLDFAPGHAIVEQTLGQIAASAWRNKLRVETDETVASLRPKEERAHEHAGDVLEQIEAKLGISEEAVDRLFKSLGVVEHGFVGMIPAGSFAESQIKTIAHALQNSSPDNARYLNAHLDKALGSGNEISKEFMQAVVYGMIATGAYLVEIPDGLSTAELADALATRLLLRNVGVLGGQEKTPGLARVRQISAYTAHLDSMQDSEHSALGSRVKTLPAEVSSEAVSSQDNTNDIASASAQPPAVSDRR